MQSVYVLLMIPKQYTLNMLVSDVLSSTQIAAMADADKGVATRGSSVYGLLVF